MVMKIDEWINEVNTTSLRIITSIIGVVLNITALTIAILAFGWEPTSMQLKVLTGEAGVLLTMMGFDVIQFASKRWTNTDYASAKNPPTQVIANPPSTVQVQGDAVVTGKPDQGEEGTPNA